MTENIFDALLRKIVNYYYNLLTTSSNLLKNCGEMPITYEEHRANMAFLKNASGAYYDCYK